MLDLALIDLALMIRLEKIVAYGKLATKKSRIKKAELKNKMRHFVYKSLSKYSLCINLKSSSYIGKLYGRAASTTGPVYKQMVSIARLAAVNV